MKPRYKYMLNRMREKEEAWPRKKRDPWFLYILECSGGSLYTGIAKNLEKRLKMHNNGKASKFTRAHLPVKLLYHETCSSRTQALIRECAVKAMPRKRKLALVQLQNNAQKAVSEQRNTTRGGRERKSCRRTN